jgi:PEP-CTERM motif
MVKFVAASIFTAACVLGVGSTAQASSISSECIQNPATLSIHCDLVEGSDNGNSAGVDPEYARADFAGAGWLVGYTFVLEPGMSYTGSGDNGNISDVVVIHDSYFELFSQGHASFNAMLNAALLLTPIDATPLSAGQIVGTPFYPGVPADGGIGLVNEALNGSAQLVGIFFTDGDAGDTVSINPVDSTAVPEPATLTLVGLGSALALRRRRKARF